MEEKINIRKAKLQDVAAMLEIYNDEVRNSTATFDIHERTIEERTEWFRRHESEIHPIFVAEKDGCIAGYVSLSKYREKEAYKATVELSVYVNKKYRKMGVANALMDFIVKYAKGIEGIHCIVSVITSGNAVSEHLHKKYGFVYSGTLHEVGMKFGKYCGVDNYQLILENGERDGILKYKKRIIMNKNELLFYNAYEEFYAMAEKSKAFQAFCADAFGEDFSQDGFSDIRQIDMILQYVPDNKDVHILDIGCGNGKMLGYLQRKTNAYIHGFDYSEKAIKTAQKLYPVNSDFKEGIIGEIEYPVGSFDVITSMDTMYFAQDMSAFVAQIKKWLKTEGVFFAGYQEGDVMFKTENAETTELAEALKENGMVYEVIDITKQTYDLLVKKREAAMLHQAEFEAEDCKIWFDMLMEQTNCITESYEEFSKKMARYIFVVRKI